LRPIFITFTTSAISCSKKVANVVEMAALYVVSYAVGLFRLGVLENSKNSVTTVNNNYHEVDIFKQNFQAKAIFN